MSYFQPHEFECKCGCGDMTMNPGFVTRLENLRAIYGKPLTVSSGKRCPSHNAKVSSTGRTGPHTTGYACDFAVDRGDAHKLLECAMALRFKGIGVQQKGGGRFIHVDDLPDAPGQPRPTVWSY